MTNQFIDKKVEEISKYFIKCGIWQKDKNFLKTSLNEVAKESYQKGCDASFGKSYDNVRDMIRKEERAIVKKEILEGIDKLQFRSDYPFDKKTTEEIKKIIKNK